MSTVTISKKELLKKLRIRSPNYPIIPIGKALEYADIVLKNQHRYLVPLDVLSKDWGMAKGSYFAQHIAALSSYGLIDVEGEKDGRKIKISDVAYRILVDKRPASEERETLIKEVSLKPSIFRKIYEAYPSGLPADHALEFELTTTYHFNPGSITDFISIFKQTIDYAKIYNSGIRGDEETPIEELDGMQNGNLGKKEEPVSSAMRLRPPPPLPTNLKLNVYEREIANYPVGRGLKARILVSGSSPITIDSIEKLIKLLDLNKEDIPDIIETASAEEKKDEPIEP